MSRITLAHSLVVGSALAAALIGSAGCLTSSVDPRTLSEGGTAAAARPRGPTKNEGNKDVIPYRDLATHPGCTVAGLDTRTASAYVPATIPGYKCAAKAYPLPNEDKTKPIVLLMHGNSSTPGDWEKFPADKADALPMLADRLVAQNYRVLAVDVRYDKVDDPHADKQDRVTPVSTSIHGWAVPIPPALHRLGDHGVPRSRIVTRRVLGRPPPSRATRSAASIARARSPSSTSRISCSRPGSHHGVSSFRALCGTNPHDARQDSPASSATAPPSRPPSSSRRSTARGGAWETPCADGDTAYGQKGVCGTHKVTYTTVVMKDVKEGTYQDEFVSEGSSEAGRRDQPHRRSHEQRSQQLLLQRALQEPHGIDSAAKRHSASS